MTTLIIGGAYQGKTEYVMSLARFGGGAEAVADAEAAGIADGATLTKEAFEAAACVNYLHLFVKRLLGEGMSPEEIHSFILGHLADKMLICDDICSGIVPVDRGEIAYRETVGRLLCEIAKYADTVVRMQCGIAQIWKGEAPC